MDFFFLSLDRAGSRLAQFMIGSNLIMSSAWLLFFNIIKNKISSELNGSIQLNSDRFVVSLFLSNYLEYIADRRFLFESTKLYLYTMNCSLYGKIKNSLYFLQFGVFLMSNITMLICSFPQKVNICLLINLCPTYFILLWYTIFTFVVVLIVPIAIIYLLYQFYKQWKRQKQFNSFRENLPLVNLADLEEQDKECAICLST